MIIVRTDQQLLEHLYQIRRREFATFDHSSSISERAREIAYGRRQLILEILDLVKLHHEQANTTGDGSQEYLEQQLWTPDPKEEAPPA